MQERWEIDKLKDYVYIFREHSVQITVNKYSIAGLHLFVVQIVIILFYIWIKERTVWTINKISWFFNSW